MKTKRIYIYEILKEVIIMEFLVVYFTVLTIEVVGYSVFKYMDNWMMEEDCN